MRIYPAHSPFHFLRAALLSAGILSLAAGAHVLGGGELPAPAILTAVLALTVLAATTATRLKLNVGAMTALLGAGQLVLHEVFSAFSFPALAAGQAPAGVHHVSVTAMPALEAAAHHHATGSTGGPLMLVAHVVATAACAVLLARGEGAFWSLAAWLRPLVRLQEAVKPDAGPSPAVPVAPAARPLRPWRNQRQHSRRGPPSAVVIP